MGRSHVRPGGAGGSRAGTGRPLGGGHDRAAGRAAADFASIARDVAARGAWDERWLDHLDDPPREKTFGGAIAHVVTHGMHHRAQLLYMLRRLGLRDLPEGDVLSWENRPSASAP